MSNFTDGNSDSEKLYVGTRLNKPRPTSTLVPGVHQGSFGGMAYRSISSLSLQGCTSSVPLWKLEYNIIRNMAISIFCHGSPWLALQRGNVVSFLGTFPHE